MLWAAESPFSMAKVSYLAESMLDFSTAVLAKERHDQVILLTWCSTHVAICICVQVHDNANKISTISATIPVSPSCNHPNSDGWPVLSTGRRNAERARPKAVLARAYYVCDHEQTQKMISYD